MSMKFLSYLKHRCHSCYVHSSHSFSSMQAWQCFEYGGINSLTLSKTARLPSIRGCNDVLVKVEATSVNPLDVQMTSGFGKRVCGIFRNASNFYINRMNTEFPVIFGRDFSGIVVDSGKNCSDLKPGDEIWGNVPFHQPGCHAEYTISCKYFVSKKPKNLKHIEAASVPYVCLTTLSALFSIGLKLSTLANKRILVIGGSGGVGTFAIQWLKYTGAYVATTASLNASELLINLGADVVIDYNDPNYMSDLIAQNQKFDVILDAASATGVRDEYSGILKRNGKYVTLTSPVLHNFDSYGLFGGVAKSISDIVTSNMQAIQKGYTHHWAIAAPLTYVLQNVHDAYESGMIVPVIDKVFGFDETPEAYNNLKQGHARGKTIIDMNVPHQTDLGQKQHQAN